MQNRKSLNEPFEELGKQFRSIPHLIIGKETIKKAIEKPKTVEIVKPEIYSEVSSYPNVLKEPIPEPKKDEFFTPEQEKWLKRLKTWGLIVCVLVVVVYALYRIIWFW